MGSAYSLSRVMVPYHYTHTTDNVGKSTPHQPFMRQPLGEIILLKIQEIILFTLVLLNYNQKNFHRRKKFMRKKESKHGVNCSLNNTVDHYITKQY